MPNITSAIYQWHAGQEHQCPCEAVKDMRNFTKAVLTGQQFNASMLREAKCRHVGFPPTAQLTREKLDVSSSRRTDRCNKKRPSNTSHGCEVNKKSRNESSRSLNALPLEDNVLQPIVKNDLKLDGATYPVKGQGAGTSHEGLVSRCSSFQEMPPASEARLGKMKKSFLAKILIFVSECLIHSTAFDDCDDCDGLVPSSTRSGGSSDEAKEIYCEARE